MEWGILLAFAAIAAAAMLRPGAPWRSDAAVQDARTERYQRLLQELRDLDDDATEGRISADERIEARRALAPELRELVAALRESGAGDWREAREGTAR